MLTDENYQQFVLYLCSDLKLYLPIYWKLFIGEVTKHTNYKLENLELEINDDHIYFLHNNGNESDYFQFIAITNRGTCHDNAQARLDEWNLPTNYDLPTLWDGVLTETPSIKHLCDVKYVKNYIDSYIRDRKINTILHGDDSCTECDRNGVIDDDSDDYNYCTSCGGLKIILPGIKTHKMIR